MTFNSSKIYGILILIIGVFLAIWLGLGIVTNQVQTIVQILAVLVLIVCLGLGRKIWLLIPFTANLNLGLRLPGEPDSFLVGQILVVIFIGLLLLMRKMPYQFNFTELEAWMLVLFMMTFQSYVRNPVGLLMFGGDTVGAKPYAIFMIAMITGLVIGGIRVPVKEMALVMKVSIIGGLLNLGVSIISVFVPKVAFFLGTSFTDTSQKDYSKSGVAIDEGASTRIGFLGNFGKNVSLWVSSTMSPLKACFSPMWGMLIILAIVCAAMSGFRNNIISVGIILILGIYYRNGIGSVLVSGFAAIGGVALLALVNQATPLPPNMQRSLTFLPGTWEQRYKDDAKESSDWRFEIWEEALTSDKWIKNKIWGDGLGLSMQNLQTTLAMDQTKKGASGLDAQKEGILISGNYHSGPVQTIRTIGYVGLILLIIAQIRLAVHAHRQILRCRNTEWFSLACLIGIPLVYNPLFFILVFGEFKTATATLFVGSAMVRLLQNNLPLPAWQKVIYIPYTLSNSNRLK